MASERHWTDEDYRPIDPEQHSWDNGVDLYRMEVPEMEHGFHGTSDDVENGVVRATADRPGSEKTFDDSPSHFVNYWTPNPLARIYRDGLADPVDDPGETPEKLRDEAEAEAWNWGEKSSEYADGGRPRVYEGRAVTAMDRPMGIDPNLPEDINMSWQHILPMAAGAFEVTDTHWIPPGKDGKAVQGTLPHVNWNQFGAPNVGNPEDVQGGLTPFDKKIATRHRGEARRQLYAMRKEGPDHGPALPNAARDAERRSVEAGQMRLPGF